MRSWNPATLTAVGIGIGAALAASMGPAGYALGIAAALLPMGLRAVLRRSCP